MKTKLLIFWNIIITILLAALLFSSCGEDTSRIEELESRVNMLEWEVSSLNARVEYNYEVLQGVEVFLEELSQVSELEQFMQLWELFEMFGW